DPHRERLGHERAGREGADQTVRRDAETDEVDAGGKDARRGRLDAAGALVFLAGLTEPLKGNRGSTTSSDPRRRAQEPDLARRRRRSALQARRPRARDDRPLQRPDAAVDDRARRGARPPLARERRAAVGDRQQAAQDARHQRLLKELLEYLARELVDEPDEVSVEEFEEDDGTLVLELSVADDDYGKVIGRGGRTANALRLVVKAAAVQEDRRVLVDIVD